MKTIVRTYLVTILFILFFENVYSQKEGNDTVPNIDDYYIDFSVPDLGAFTLLNTKPDNITTPGSTKEFAASLLNVVSGGSKISPGLAIDWAPVRTFYKTTSPEDYRKSHLLRNLQMTLGTIADSSGTKAAAGIKWTFIDHTDPLLDTAYSVILNRIHDDVFTDLPKAKISFFEDLESVLGDIFLERGLTDDYFEQIVQLSFNLQDTTIIKREVMINFQVANDTINLLIKKLSQDTYKALNALEKDKLLKLCIQFKNLSNTEDQYYSDVIAAFNIAKKQWLNSHWNATVVTFGAGWVGNSTDNKWSTLNAQLFKTYLNGKFRVSDKTQAIGIVSFGVPHITISTDSSIVSQMFLGGRFLVGNARNRFSVDLGLNFDNAKVTSYNSQTLIADIGVEFKLDDGIFLEIAGGFKGEPTNFIKNSNILALGSLKYALHPKSRFNLSE